MFTTLCYILFNFIEIFMGPMQFMKEKKRDNILIMGRQNWSTLDDLRPLYIWKKFSVYWWWLHYLLIKTDTFNVENLAPALANPSFCQFSLNEYILQTIYRADPQNLT